MTNISITFDKPVFSDPELTQEAIGPFGVVSTTRLPSDVYYSSDIYTITGKNILGKTLWTAVFTYPTHVLNNTISVDTGAVFS